MASQTSSVSNWFEKYPLSVLLDPAISRASSYWGRARIIGPAWHSSRAFPRHFLSFWIRSFNLWGTSALIFLVEPNHSTLAALTRAYRRKFLFPLNKKYQVTFQFSVRWAGTHINPLTPGNNAIELDDLGQTNAYTMLTILYQALIKASQVRSVMEKRVM